MEGGRLLGLVADAAPLPSTAPTTSRGADKAPAGECLAWPLPHRDASSTRRADPNLWQMERRHDEEAGWPDEQTVSL